MAERSIKKQNFVHLLFHKKGVNKYLLRVLYFCVGCFALFAFAYLFTASDLFAWLMYGAISMGIVVSAIGIIWHIRDVAKEMKENNQEE